MRYSDRLKRVISLAWKKWLYTFSVFYFVSCGFITAISAQEPFSTWKFSASEAQQLSNGEIITSTAAITGKVLPKVTVWVFISAAPRDVFAIVYDVTNDKNYYEGIIKSEIIRKIVESKRDVRFVHAMPWPIPDEDYIIQQTFDFRDGRYRTSWKMLSGNRIKSSSGYWLFEQFGKGTLLTIEIGVELSPAISRIPFVKKIGIAMVEDNAKKIRARVQNIVHKEPEVLQSLQNITYQDFGIKHK